MKLTLKDSADSIDPCLPANTYIDLQASSKTVEMQKDIEEKTWMFAFCITILAIAATYFTVHELKEVANSLDQREQVGQRENYAKKLSLLSNSIICMWNMAYSLTFFVLSMYWQVRLLVRLMTCSFIESLCVLCHSCILVLHAGFCLPK